MDLVWDCLVPNQERKKKGGGGGGSWMKFVQVRM